MTCVVCGSADIQEIRCKIVCRNCGTILQSCADLGAAGPAGSGEAADRMADR